MWHGACYWIGNLINKETRNIRNRKQDIICFKNRRLGEFTKIEIIRLKHKHNILNILGICWFASILCVTTWKPYILQLKMLRFSMTNQGQMWSCWFYRHVSLNCTSVIPSWQILIENELSIVISRTKQFRQRGKPNDIMKKQVL